MQTRLLPQERSRGDAPDSYLAATGNASGRRLGTIALARNAIAGRLVRVGGVAPLPLGGSERQLAVRRALPLAAKA
jgi:hypothetical protein